MQCPKTLTVALSCLTLLSADAAMVQLELDRTAGTMIVVERPALYPEGIDHDPLTDQFFLSSVRDGSITAVTRDGVHRPFLRDDRLVSTIGVRVDSDRRRLLTLNADYGVALRTSEATSRKAGGLAMVDLGTGALQRYVDLATLRPGAPIFLNDLDVDADGNVYVTNSLSPVIYKVTPDGTATVLLEDHRFMGQGFNLNGIQVHPDGFLLVAKKSDGALFKVPLDRPEAWSEVRLPQPFVATDGIRLAGDRLVLVRNRSGQTVANEIVVLRSGDGWASATVEDRMPVQDLYATTVAIRGGEVWVSQGRLHTLAPGDDAPLTTFTILRIATLPG